MLHIVVLFSAVDTICLVGVVVVEALEWFCTLSRFPTMTEVKKMYNFKKKWALRIISRCLCFWSNG